MYSSGCDLRDNQENLNNGNYVVLGVSSDSIKSHQKFIEKFDLNFDLISDEDKSVHKMYGTWVEKKCMEEHIWVQPDKLSLLMKMDNF